MAVLFENMLMQLADSQRDTLAYVLGATFLMFVVLLRSLGLATLALLPNVLGERQPMFISSVIVHWQNTGSALLQWHQAAAFLLMNYQN